ncbi:MAG: DNA polymerase III subunit alpha [Candidatus Dojkabacteria bacterium]
MSFTHLHLHTEYSLLDGLNRSVPLMEKVKETGMEAVAITDHGVMYGASEFWITAKDFGIKPILGCELYLAPDKRTIRQPVDGIKYYHLLVLAKNAIGYRNLNKLVSVGQLEGMYYKPRVDKETLKKYSEGLIATSACLAGPLSRHILRDEPEKMEEWLQFFLDTYGDDFYLEIQRNGFHNSDEWKEEFGKGVIAEHIDTMKRQMKVNKRLRELSAERGIKLITTTDAHYLNQEDKLTQEVILAIKDGRELTDPKHRIGYLDTYVKTPEEMKAHFQDIPEVLDLTNEINEKIEQFDISYDRVQPHYIATKADEKGKSAQELLKKQVYEGAKSMYDDVDKKLEERIEYELDVIHEKGYDDYFLVVSDIIKWARSQGIVVGVRGSVAGSVVAYCLDIINVEPLGWELYFERFLNPERPSPPDIDMDFQDDRRDEVIAYVEEKYGRENVAAICAIGRMKTKAAIRDVARVMGIDLKLADKLSKMVHVIFGKVKPISKMMQDDPEFATLVNSSPELQKLKDTVVKIEGMARHVSTHACGYLITPEEITNYVSVQYETSKKNSEKVITQAEGVWIEELGLMKFDFLGLRNLTIIKNTIELIEKYHGVRIDTKQIPLDDEKTFALFGRGETIGVFQFESPPMQKYLKELQPENLEDLCFMVSAYRPGPMKYIPDYIECRHGRKEPEYLIPEMKSILEKTYGFAIYQEQVIKISVDIAGYSMGHADLLRRAMGKKKIKIMNEEEPRFKKGVMAKGYDQDIADKIWEYLLPFADYGFNKAHGASYALVAYWCAYLKANYPIEFMTGLMHSDINDPDRIAIDMSEARKMNFTILPPDINKSDSYFTIEKGGYIRFGLGAVKNVGDKMIHQLLKERKENGNYEDFDDFLKRTIGYKFTKKAIECLIKIGAFDLFAQRNQLIAILETAYEKAAKSFAHEAIGQNTLFGGDSDDKGEGKRGVFDKTKLPELDDIDDKQKIAWERELLNTFVTAHPLDYYSQITLNPEIFSLRELISATNISQTSFKEGQRYKFLALIAAKKNLLTKAGSRPMAIITLEDQEGQVEAVVFPKAYEELKDKLNEGEAVLVFAQLNERDDKLSLIVEDIYPAKSVEAKNELKIDICKVQDVEEIQQVRQLIADNHGGNVKLVVFYGSETQPKKFQTTVKYSRDLVIKLEKYSI